MDDFFWCRRARLTLGANKTSEGTVFGSDEHCNHLIDFNVEKTRDSSKNKGRITIYNLSKDERNLIDSDYDRLVLQLGYQGDTPFDQDSGFWSDVVDGWVYKLTHEKSGTEIKTIIEYVEAKPEQHKRDVNITFDSGTKHTSMVKKIIESSLSYLTIGDISGIKEGYVVPNGRSRTVNGQAVEELRKIALSHDSRLTIDNNVIHIIDNNSGFNDKSVPVFTSKSGLIGNASRTEKGISFDCFLHPFLRPNQFVIVKDEFIGTGRQSKKLLTDKEKNQASQLTLDSTSDFSNDSGGIYRINKVVFSGSNRGSNFKCNVEAQKSDGYKVIRPIIDYSPVATFIPTNSPND